MKKRRVKKWMLGLSVALAVSGVGLGSGIAYLYHYAIARNKKDFMDAKSASGTSQKERPIKEWDFLTYAPVSMTQKTPDGLTLRGNYLANPKQNGQEKRKLIILVHGYTSRSTLLESYAKLYYEAGYDLFLPDARGHGNSEGDYIGFGWPDRLDLKRWIKQIVDDYNGNVEIGLWGVSMGGATVMMASGEDLPKQVKCIVEDSGYTSTADELTYQLKEMFHLPSFPVIPIASAYTEWRDGYNFYESDAVTQLHKNHLPILFIHGGKDTFVPSYMEKKVYEATAGPKQIEYFKSATHARNYECDPERYRQVTLDFFKRYMD